MRLIFFGYHNIGHICLEVLGEFCRQYGDEIVAVVTHADDPDENRWFASVRDLAFNQYYPAYQPTDPNEPGFVEVLRRLQPDFIFSCYYRQMLKKPLLDLPRAGALNLHGSLLPRYRGRCPVNWVLIHGETETGVTLHYMAEQPDRGDIVAQQRVPITLEDTALTLFNKMTVAAGALMRDSYPRLRAGSADRIPQDQAQASYFGGRRPEDGKIDWRQSAWQIYNLVRAVTHPYPGAFTTYQGRKLFVWQGKTTEESLPPDSLPGTVIAVRPDAGLLIATGQGGFLLQQGQFAGEPELSGLALADCGIRPGQRLGED
ncbi:MAG: formyltransferase [Desulfobacca sp.]|nr:formyltransferase [Desulfobacca sp.]